MQFLVKMPFVEPVGWKVGCLSLTRVITKETSLPGMGENRSPKERRQTVSVSLLSFFFFPQTLLHH
jgi:hypothetical protein